MGAHFYAFLAPEPQAPLARNELKTLTPRKWAFPPTLPSTFYARVAFLAPEPQASLARNERETLAPQKWAFPPTLQSTFYARVAFLAPEPQAPLARNELKAPLESGRSRQHYKVLSMREWRSLRLNRKRRSRATNGRHLPLKSGRSRQHYQSTFYARVAFLAPESQASLARNERETLAPQKWAFPPTLPSTFYGRVAFLAPEPQASLARARRTGDTCPSKVGVPANATEHFLCASGVPCA